MYLKCTSVYKLTYISTEGVVRYKFPLFNQNLVAVIKRKTNTFLTVVPNKPKNKNKTEIPTYR